MTTRRTALGWLALGPLAGLVSTTGRAQGSGAVFFPAPVPYGLCRRVERELRGGAQLIVERTWSVRFVPQGRGFRLDGQQTKVTVDAPPALSVLAQMESSRVDQGMFPLLLGSAGEIVGQSATRDDEALAAAIATVRARLTAVSAQGLEADAVERFLRDLQQAGEETLAAWPTTLFAPGEVDVVQERAVPLPAGRTGTVTVRTLASSDPATGLMRQFERQVETRLETRVRSGLERFTLAPE